MEKIEETQTRKLTLKHQQLLCYYFSILKHCIVILFINLWQGRNIIKCQTTPDYIEYVCEQISGTGNIRYRKMFGEYVVYVNEKPILLVCDNTVYVKMLDIIAGIMKDAEKGFPYQGAKEHYILDIDDSQLSREVIHLLEPHISIPKPKKKK